MRWLASLAWVAALCGVCYVLGRSHARVNVITEQIEVIKYVEKKKAEIAARPNADRAALLALMRNGKL